MDALLENGLSDNKCCYHSNIHVLYQCTIIRYNSKAGVLSLVVGVSSLVAFIIQGAVLTSFIYFFFVEYLTLELIVLPNFCV